MEVLSVMLDMLEIHCGMENAFTYIFCLVYFSSTLGFIESTLGYLESTLGCIGSALKFIESTLANIGSFLDQNLNQPKKNWITI